MSNLTLQLLSFSYKKGLPLDDSSHGGGFVFDCRCLPNPGRQAAYSRLTGKDKEVKDFLEEEPRIEVFYQNSKNLVELAINNYVERGFEHLLVSYGCTGGQHRSVYMAERLNADLSLNKNLDIDFLHRERIL